MSFIFKKEKENVEGANIELQTKLYNVELHRDMGTGLCIGGSPTPKKKINAEC